MSWYLSATLFLGLMLWLPVFLAKHIKDFPSDLWWIDALSPSDPFDEDPYDFPNPYLVLPVFYHSFRAGSSHPSVSKLSFLLYCLNSIFNEAFCSYIYIYIYWQ